MREWTSQGTPKALAKVKTTFNKYAERLKKDELVEQPVRSTTDLLTVGDPKRVLVWNGVREVGLDWLETEEGRKAIRGDD
jgi:hypothetical protein